MPFVSARSALQLTEEELEYINRASKSRTLPESAVERAKILLEYYERKSISQIARDLGTNRPKVERTIDKAFAYGIYAALGRVFQGAADREKYPPAQEHGFCLLLAQNHWTTDIHMNYGHNVYWQNISEVYSPTQF